MEERENSIAWDLIKDRSDTLNKLIRALVIVVIVMSVALASVVGAFIWYLNQYDFVSKETTVEATSEDGGATAVLNEDGEVTIDGESKGN